MSIIEAALTNGLFTVDHGYYQSTREEIGHQSDLAYFLWNGDKVRLGGDIVNVVESSDLSSGYDHHGDPVKVVFEAFGKTWIAEGEYDSWGGEHFENGIFEAELVMKPVWVAKSESN